MSSTLHDELGDLVSEIDGVYNVANTYRKNYFVALLDNMVDSEAEGETILGRFTKVLQDLQDVQDYSQKENDRYMETYTAKVNQLQAAWQKLANDEQGLLAFKKWLVDAGIAVTNLVDEMGGIVPTLVSIGNAVGLIVTLVKAKDISNGLISITEQLLHMERGALASAAAVQTLSSALSYIGIAVSVVVGLTTAISAYNREQRQARDDTIAAWEEQKEQAKQIENLLEKLDDLNQDSEDYRKTEDKLIELLGDKKILLEDLTKGTEEYSNKVRELTEAELEHQRFLQLEAKEAAGKNLVTAFSDYTTGIGSGLGKRRDFVSGYADKINALSGNWFTGYSASKDADDVLNSLRIIKILFDEVSKEYEHLKVAGEKIPEEIEHNYEVLKAAWDEVGDEYEKYLGMIEEETKLREEASRAAEEYANTSNQTGDAKSTPRSTVEMWTEIAEKTEKQAKALETVAKAQKEYNDSGTVSASTLKNLLGLGEDWQKVLFDEHQRLDLNSDSVKNLAKEYENALATYHITIPGLEELTGTREKVRVATEEETKALQKNVGEKEKAIQATRNQIDIGKEFKTNIETVNAAQKELEHTGKLSIETQEKLLGLKENLVRAMIDEDGNIDVNSDKVQKLIAKWTEYCEQLGFVIEDTYKVGAVTDETLNKIKETISLRESELTLLEKSDAGLDERVAKIRGVVHWIEEEIVHLQQTGAEQIEINKLEAERLDYLNKITKLYDAQEKARQKAIEDAEKLAEEQRKAAEQAAKEAEEAEKARIKAYEDWIKSNISAYDSQVSYYNSELNLLKAQGGTIAEQEEWYRKINAKLEEKINYLSTLGGYETEINNLKREQLENEQKIADLYEKEAEARKKEEEERKKEEENRKKEEEQAFKDRLAGYDGEIARLQSVLSLAKAQGATVTEQAEIEKQILEQIGMKIEAYEETGEHETEINKLKLEQLELEKTIAELLEREVTDLQDAKLKGIRDEISLYQSRLKLAQGTYGAEEEQEAILADINELYREQIEYLISIEASELEINKVKAEQLSIQSQILALQRKALDLENKAHMDALQDTLNALLAGIEVEEESLELTEEQVDLEEQRRKELEESAKLEKKIAEAKLEYIESVIDAYLKAENQNATLEEKQAAVAAAREKVAAARREAVAKALEAAYNAQKEAESDALALEEKRFAVEKARIALNSAENDLTTRVYNEETGTWERTRNEKAVASAQSAFDKAVKSLNDYVEEQAWSEVIEAVGDGSLKEEELTEILKRWEAEHYGEESPEFIKKIRDAYRESLGSVNDSDTVIGAEKDVQNAVESLNEYLKQEAVKELKDYLEAGNRDAAGMQAILDKWLGLGEGTQLYEWRDGLLGVVTEAIESNYYDDSKIRESMSEISTSVKNTTSAVNKTTKAVEKMEKTFISEITKAAKVSADAVRGVIEKYQDKVDQKYLDWAEEVFSQRSEMDEYTKYTTNVVRNGLTQQEIDRKIQEMKANSAAWNSADEEFRKQLANQNLVLGTQLGWHRDQASGIWYDENGNRAYDRGGVLRGYGGIKATGRPEVVLDPDLTEKILRPNSEAQFRAFADALGLIFERGDRLMSSSRPIINGQRYSDSHNTSTVINGVPIPAAAAENYTVAELARAMSIV